MAPRKAAQPAPGTPAKRARNDAGDTPTPADKKALSQLPWWPEAQKLVAEITSAASIDEYLLAQFGGDQQQLAKFLADAFPPDPAVHYAAAVPKQSQSLCLGPHQMSIKANFGNKGMIIGEHASNLIQLILLKGFLTRPEDGAEMIMLCDPDPKLVPDLAPGMPTVEGCAGFNSFAYIKGWSRSVCAVAAMFILTKLGVHSTLAAGIQMSFSTIYCAFRHLPNPSDAIDLSRGGDSAARICLGEAVRIVCIRSLGEAAHFILHPPLPRTDDVQHCHPREAQLLQPPAHAGAQDAGRRRRCR